MIPHEFIDGVFGFLTENVTASKVKIDNFCKKRIQVVMSATHGVKTQKIPSTILLYLKEIGWVILCKSRGKITYVLAHYYKICRQMLT